MLNEQIKAILDERFKKDSLLALATINGDYPSVRTVNVYYENECFYIITHALSNKMKHIDHNPHVALSGEWFSAHGVAINLGYFGKDENKKLANKLAKVFSSWINNGHNNFADKNTIILCIRLNNGVLFSNGTRYELTFGV
ncbi:MAG TPA: pyridoxamine 5'-phosphate oxidase family protein [Bacilli bacterium]|nr:pyridoxamine 5'-phosphate oxidase family protein [Bacilli bacterium]